MIKSEKSEVMEIASLDLLHLVALNTLQQMRRHSRGINNSLLLLNANHSVLKNLA